MQKNNCLVSDRGSAPLEMAALLALLLLPIGPMITVYSAVFDAIAAESIARHSLRLATLSSDKESIGSRLQESVTLFSKSWLKPARFEFECGDCQEGSLLFLKIKVGDATAIQIAGLEQNEG